MDHKRGARFNVLHNACLKAQKVAQRYNGKEYFVIGADTIVLLGKRLMGKPKTKKEAKSFLRAFSGKTISVYTGVCVIDAKGKKSAGNIAVSKIKVRKISSEQIDKFVKISGPHDKAGGFSIEGPGTFIFDDIEGSFYNILGLSMMTLYNLFKELNVNLMDFAI